MYGLSDRLKPLSAAEEQVLLALWDCPAPATRRDISEKLTATGWAPATVLNFLYRLEEKGWVKGGKAGDWPMWVEEMRKHDVPEWYIESLAKIGYLFPKAHAVAYVMMAFRIAWFKVHEPLAFYATFFSIRAKAFDAAECCKDVDALRRRIREIENNKDATAVEQNLMALVLTKERLNEFIKTGEVKEQSEIFEEFDVTMSVIESLLVRERDSEGKIHISWGSQRIMN